MFITSSELPTPSDYVTSRLRQILLDGNRLTTISENYWIAFKSLQFVSMTNNNDGCVHTKIPDDVVFRGETCPVSSLNDTVTTVTITKGE